jgi:hypothetical protein
VKGPDPLPPSVGPSPPSSDGRGHNPGTGAVAPPVSPQPTPDPRPIGPPPPPGWEPDVRVGETVIVPMVPHRRPEVTMADVARAWAPSTFRAMGPGPQLPSLPPGLAALHNGANQEVAQAGAQSGRLIVEIGSIGVQLQMIAGEATLGATARAALGAGASVAPKAAARGTTAVASTGEGSAPATLVREISHGEKVSTLVHEVAERTYTSGGPEHAIISTRSGQRLIVQGGRGGMSFAAFDLRRVLLHTHPTPTGPSGLDFLMLQQMGQRSSWIYELFGGGLTRFRRP